MASNAESDLDALFLNRPDEADKLLQSYNALLGSEQKQTAEIINLAAVRYELNRDPRRYTLGLERITRHMNPIEAGELVVIGAREGQGKTALAEKLVLDNALRHRVFFATLEMRPDEIKERAYQKLMRMSAEDVRAAKGDKHRDFGQATYEMTQRDLLIWYPRSKKQRTVTAIGNQALTEGADMLVIDYSRRIEGWNPVGGASEIMDYLSSFVRETRITTVLLSQLNRSAAGKRPDLSQLQDTGKLEQSADRAILIWRPWLGNQQRDHVAEIIVAKNRKGPAFRSHAHWVGKTMDFFDMDDVEEASQDCCRGKHGAE